MSKKPVDFHLFKAQMNPIETQKDVKDDKNYCGAPYNFIPLNEKVVFTNYYFGNDKFDKYYCNENFKTGYIDINIDTKGNIFIMGNHDNKKWFEVFEKIKINLSKFNHLEKIIYRLEKDLNKNEKLKNEKSKSNKKNEIDVINTKIDEITNKINQNKKELKEKYESLIELLNSKELIKYFEKTSKFYSPLGIKPVIPGSSLRGMIRTTIEIISYGYFKNFSNDRLYYRALADMSVLRKQYTEHMVDVNNNHTYMFQAGILKKIGYKDYRIYPSQKIYRAPSIYNGWKHKITNSGTPPIEIEDDKFIKVFFNPSTETDHLPHGGKRTVTLRFAELDGLRQNRQGNYQTPGYLIASGKMNDKKYQWVIDIPDTSEEGTYYKIPDEVIRNHNHDINRKGNILDLLDTSKDVPCFFITKDNNIFSFGHNGFFRLGYNKTLKEHIPDELRNFEIEVDEESNKKDNIKKFDIAEMMFGNDADFAGRVFFEDAPLLSGNNQKSEMDFHQILSSPKPTTFQHYLEQIYKTADQKKFPPYGDLFLRNTYNDNTNIRGYKLYWHKEDNQWIQDKKDEVLKHSTQYPQKISPIKNATFKGRIRFENLTNVELGALLFALDLPPECCHKIGMGKPLGLGSIRITPILFLSNRVNRYNDLFAEWGNETEHLSQKKVNEYKDEFATFILNTLEQDNTTHNFDDLWEVERMKQLRRILDFDHRPENEKTRYMQIELKDEKGKVVKDSKGKKINEFKNRSILPKPTDV
ncbi:MAG: TIGR03986 family CRISPR-associated RAMP protein [Ignavibacteriae bacterium]|nr:MAG: TIGR03986 family CRISPR-associated RAMP protein [Ignavibacteriota bacterium]